MNPPVNRPLLRIILLVIAVIMFLIAWCGTADVLFTGVNVTAWIAAGLATFTAAHLA